MPVAAGVIELDSVLGTDLGDRSIWATSISKAQARNGKGVPSTVDLETALTNLKITDTMKGSSTIVVSLEDQDWALIDSGFFDANRDGKIDPIDVNYPQGTDQWWRCTQVGVDATRGGAKVELTFMERPAVYLMSHFGPLKASRGAKTRAEFLKWAAGHVKAGGGIDFRSAQLHKKQQIAKEDPADVKQREKERKNNKGKGIHPKEAISFTNYDGGAHTFTSGELRNASRVLDEALTKTNDDRPVLAVLCACIVEAPFFRNPVGGDRTSVGILQLLDIHGPASKRRDIAWCVAKFMTEGFTGRGGAADLAKQHRDWSVGQIAQAVQGSAYPDRYDKVEDGAKKVLEAYGGSGASMGEYTQQYNFEIGGTDNPHENFWDGMNRLADEVKWPLFFDGSNLYYDPEPVLVTQQPAAVIHRDDPEVVSFQSNWDMRQIATEATIVLVCDPFEFRAGEVFKLEGFGPASSGSTAKLPGRWLIEDVDRDRFSVVSTFTLKQPEDPNPEPRSTTTTHEDDGSGLTGDLRARIVQVAKDSMTSKTGFKRYSQPGTLTANPTPRAPLRSDCSQWVRAVYLKAGAKDPGTNTNEMEAKSRRTTKPKPGDLVLMPDHVELYVGDGKTIGHGSPPIDYATVDAFRSRGCWYATFDFLDDEPKHTARPGHPTGAHAPQSR